MQPEPLFNILQFCYPPKCRKAIDINRWIVIRRRHSVSCSNHIVLLFDQLIGEIHETRGAVKTVLLQGPRM